MKRTLGLACLVLSRALAADPAAIGARWLDVQADPRPNAMAGAFTAMADDDASPSYNPAGLASLTGAEVGLAHNFWILDLAQEHLDLGLPVLPQASVGLSLDYFNLGSVDSFAIGAGGTPVATGTLHPYAGILGLSWGQKLFSGLAWGATAKALVQDLGTGSASNAAAADLGLQWKPAATALGLGISVLNLGTPLDGAALPLGIHTGADYTLAEPHPLGLATEVDWVPGDPQPTLSFGGEYWLAPLFAVRAGYQCATASKAGGPTAGFGLQYGNLELDYAFDGRGGLASSQQLALNIALGKAPSGKAPANPVQTAAAPASPTAMPVVNGPAPSEVVENLHHLLEALDKGDTTTAQAQNEKLMTQILPVRQQAAAQIKDQAVQPALFAGEFEEAERSLQMMIKLDRSNPYNYQALGTVEWFLGRPDLAVENIKKAYLLDESREYLKTEIRAMGGDVPADQGGLDDSIKP